MSACQIEKGWNLVAKLNCVKLIHLGDTQGMIKAYFYAWECHVGMTFGTVCGPWPPRPLLTLFSCSICRAPWTKQLNSTMSFLYDAPVMEPVYHGLSPLKLLSQINHFLL